MVVLKTTTFPGACLLVDSIAAANFPLLTATLFTYPPKGNMLIDLITVTLEGLLMSKTSILFSALLFTANNLSVAGSKAVISAAPNPPKLIDAIS